MNKERRNHSRRNMFYRSILMRDFDRLNPQHKRKLIIDRQSDKEKKIPSQRTIWNFDQENK